MFLVATHTCVQDGLSSLSSKQVDIYTCGVGVTIENIEWVIIGCSGENKTVIAKWDQDVNHFGGNGLCPADLSDIRRASIDNG